MEVCLFPPLLSKDLASFSGWGGVFVFCAVMLPCGGRVVLLAGSSVLGERRFYDCLDSGAEILLRGWL